MSYWVKKLRKSGFDIDEVGFINIDRSMLGDWKIINEGNYGIILSSKDKILKIQKRIRENNKFNNNIVGEFLREVKIQQMVYTCTKGVSLSHAQNIFLRKELGFDEKCSGQKHLGLVQIKQEGCFPESHEGVHQGIT